MSPNKRMKDPACLWCTHDAAESTLNDLDPPESFWYESDHIYFLLLKAFYVSLFILPSFHSLRFPDTHCVVCLFLLLSLAFHCQTNRILWSAAQSELRSMPSSPTHTHTYAHAQGIGTNTHCDYPFFVFVCFWCSCAFVIVFYLFFCFLHFMFCRQLNGTGRFHGLASLDDITAIISTPPLGGFQVATPASPIWWTWNQSLTRWALSTNVQICWFCFTSNVLCVCNIR